MIFITVPLHGIEKDTPRVDIEVHAIRAVLPRDKDGVTRIVFNDQLTAFVDVAMTGDEVRKHIEKALDNVGEVYQRLE